MRPRGWRLDPAWVAHYLAVEEERLEREMARIRMETELRMQAEQAKADRQANEHQLGAYRSVHPHIIRY